MKAAVEQGREVKPSGLTIEETTKLAGLETEIAFMLARYDAIRSAIVALSKEVKVLREKRGD
jgi:hypothetical protein